MTAELPPVEQLRRRVVFDRRPLVVVVVVVVVVSVVAVAVVADT